MRRCFAEDTGRCARRADHPRQSPTASVHPCAPQWGPPVFAGAAPSRSSFSRRPRRVRFRRLVSRSERWFTRTIRCARRCGGELRIHRPLPRGGAGTLRRAPARTTLWQGCRPDRIRAVLRRDQSRRLSRADKHCTAISGAYATYPLQIVEIRKPAPCAHRTGRFRIVSLCVRA
jgi:hypothetical protein